jgi:diguanylate cyclase (GGDEF)-like protein
MSGPDDPRPTGLAGWGLPRRFPALMESDYVEFSLRVFRPGIRAWHTAALTLAVLLLAAGTALHFSGSAYAVLPLSALRTAPYQLGLLGLAMTARACLCWLAWQPEFAAAYRRRALPLAIIGHACINAVFAVQIFGPHPGYLTAIAVFAFAASFLTGLAVRQSLLVNGTVLAVLIGYAARLSLPAMTVWTNIGHIAFAMLVASILAVTLERAVRALYLENRRVGEMASRDGLTGLKNRRAFDEHLRTVWQMAVRDGRSLGVLLIDVDFFKAFNDSLGHQAGDAALQRIASVVAVTARRPLDLAARYGGEELAVILFDVSREYVAEIAECVQRTVEALGIAHPKSGVAPVVTVSTGVACVRPTADRNPQGLIRLADRGLYAAKRAGRNRSVFLDPEQEFVATAVLEAGNWPLARTGSD